MTNSKSLKRALLTSCVSILLCTAMLIGTTFAWFTDSVTSANNIIKSGNLDVEMYYADGTKDPANVTWTDASEGAIFSYDNWEPGFVDVKHIKIANEGSLALKYQVAIVANGAVSELSDVIDVYYADPAAQVADRTDLSEGAKIGTLTNVLANMPSTASGELAAGEKHTITLALKMQETAGNEYQSLSIGTDFSVILSAKQLTAEEDSFGSDYDEDAEYPVIVSTVGELRDALTNEADTVYVSAGTYSSFPASNLSAGDVIVCDEGTVFEGKSSLNIDGATVIGATFDAGSGDTSASGTINGIFKDCTFTGGSEGVRWCYTNAGETVIFENCVFKATMRGIHFDGMDGDVYFKNCVLNGFNAYGGTGTAHFEGCTFGNDESRYNGLNIYANTNLRNCTFNYLTGKTNFIDMEGTGKTLTITNCRATLDGADADIAGFVGGSKLSQNTVIYQ